MSATTKPAVVRARFDRVREVFVVELDSGLELAFSKRLVKRLSDVDDERLSRVEISPGGLHWPEVDEDLSLEGILTGRFGP